MASTNAQYFVLDSEHEDMMLLFPPPNPSLTDLWLAGRRFAQPLETPLTVRIRPGSEDGVLLDYFGTARLMSDRLVETLRSAGVDNLDTYDAVIRSKDGSVERVGYKAFNLLGVVRAAELSSTEFLQGTDSRLIDGSISSLTIDTQKARGLLMFRLAEYVGAVIVHERVKQAIEAENFTNLVFRPPSDFFS